MFISDAGRVAVRRANASDAGGIADVISAVVAERIHSAVDRAWTPQEERRFLDALSPREAVHVATSGDRIVGLQIVDRWSQVLESMAHVGQVGTFLLAGWRGAAIGRRMWRETESFARLAGYRKLVVMVRGSNLAAQAFYGKLGFRTCGRLSRQVVIDGVEDDEVLMELLL